MQNWHAEDYEQEYDGDEEINPFICGIEFYRSILERGKENNISQETIQLCQKEILEPGSKEWRHRWWKESQGSFLESEFQRESKDKSCGYDGDKYHLLPEIHNET